MSLAVGVLAAVLSARSTGVGQVVDAAMVDGAAYLATMVQTLHGTGSWRDERASNIFDGGAPNYRCYECADGRYVAVGALEPKFWFELLNKLELDSAVLPSPYDPAAAVELGEVLSEVFARRSRDEWAAVFTESDACVAPVLTLAEAPTHPHNASRQRYVSVAGVSVSAPTPQFSLTPTEAGFAPPEIGADTEAALTSLGYDEARLAELRAAGVIR